MAGKVPIAITSGKDQTDSIRNQSHYYDDQEVFGVRLMFFFWWKKSKNSAFPAVSANEHSENFRTKKFSSFLQASISGASMWNWRSQVSKKSKDGFASHKLQNFRKK